jgi:hypothetical protein
VPVKVKRVVVCCSDCGKGVDFVGVSRFDGVGGLVYSAWGGEGDGDCW